MSAYHTPGPWAVVDIGANCLSIKATGGVPTTDGVSRHSFDYYQSIGSVTQRDPHPTMGGGIPRAVTEANARLIAAAPDYHDAAEWILSAVTKNAAPVNPVAALEELALNGLHITLDAGLVLDLLKAHARATGAQP